jgi:hypothetical protein
MLHEETGGVYPDDGCHLQTAWTVRHNMQGVAHQQPSTVSQLITCMDNACYLVRPAHCTAWLMCDERCMECNTRHQAAYTLHVVHLPHSARKNRHVVSWADILLNVISGMESVLLEGCLRTMTGVSQYWFSRHLQQMFFNTIALPHINIGANVWANQAS